MKTGSNLVLAALALVALCVAPVAQASVLQAGGDRLAATQNADGMWGWPLTGTSATNTLSPIGMGLAQAYLQTNDAAQLASLQKASAALRSKTVFSPSDGVLAAQLDAILGGSENTDYVKANFYDKLAAGTYQRSGVFYNTASYVNYVRTIRSGTNANLGAWELGLGIVGAASVGADTSAWIAGTKAEIDELNSSAYYDVLGLAGAVYGLSFVGSDYDPQAGAHTSAGSVADLATTLAGYQLSSGGFTWNAFAMAAGDESVQETAYGALALNQFGRSGFAANLANARGYLANAQLATGGWENYVGEGENNEVTGEALWAYAVVPEPASLTLIALAGLLVVGRKR